MPEILTKRGIVPESALEVLRALEYFVRPVELEEYQSFEAEARRRLAERDPEDWPILAVALTFNCGIWTEDRDFSVQVSLPGLPTASNYF